MRTDVIVVMDPIGSIKIAKDTTFAMLLEAQRRGHRLHYVIPGGLSLHGGVALARTAPLAVVDIEPGHKPGEGPAGTRWAQKPKPVSDPARWC